MKIKYKATVGDKTSRELKVEISVKNKLPRKLKKRMKRLLKDRLYFESEIKRVLQEGMKKSVESMDSFGDLMRTNFWKNLGI